MFTVLQIFLKEQNKDNITEGSMILMLSNPLMSTVESF